MPRVKTKPGTRKLSEVAKLVVAPSGITSTGWPAVRDLCTRKLGLEFDGWQDGTGRLILAKREGGGLASQIGGVGLSLPRQVGKTYLIAAIVFALCILRPKLLVIWSAHHSTTHEETFLSMQAFADRAKIKPYVDQVFKGSGDEEIRFRNGSRILFGARERGFGRGIPGVDVIVSDEAQIMTEKAVDAQTSTLNTSDFGLAIYAGTPPRPEDPSDAFTRMRDEAWAGTLEDAVWIEVGGDPKGNPDDPKQWAKANPSYPHRTPTESILRQRRKLTLESFRREALGIWDESHDAPQWLTVTEAAWRLRAADNPPESGWLTGPVTLAVEVSTDQQTATVAVAGDCPGGTGVDITARKPGTAWVPGLVAGLTEAQPVARVLIDKGSLADTILTAALEEAGVDVTLAETSDVLAATGQGIASINEGGTFHRSDPVLTEAVGRSVLRKYGDAVLVDRKVGDPTPFIAVLLARWGHLNTPPAPISVYEARGLVEL